MTRRFPAGRRSRTPSGDKNSPLEALTRLIEERTKYEQWLDELEAKKSSTPPKVFDRVRHDYLARLQSVMDQLREHTAALQEHAGNLMARLRELEASEHKINEELAEAELRAQVGEITQAEWDAMERKAQRELGKLKENQEAVADDLIKIRDVLSDGDEGQDEEDAPRTAADFDELEFLKSVVGPSTSATHKVPSASAPPPRPTTPPAAAKAVSTKSGEVPLVPANATPPRATPSAGTPVYPKPGSAGQKSSGVPAKPAEAPAAPASPPDNALGMDSEAMPDAPKTLKCAECGTMNYPSEWYCERCGAELAQI